MKQKFFTTAFLALSVFIISSKTFAQTDSGGLDTGGGSGTGTVGGGTTGTPPPAPLIYTFKRNNGNGLGVCGGDAQIRVAFNPLPTDYIPCITEIWYNGSRITNVVLPVYGEIIDKTQPYVSYCLMGSALGTNNGNPLANIPPASKLTLVFGHPVTTQNTHATDNGLITQ
jgi:hypothetical protein